MTSPHPADTEAPERALFVRIGEALYGEQWQSQLARALDVSDRSVRYWLAGRPIPDGVWRDLQILLDQRRVEIADLTMALRARILA